MAASSASRASFLVSLTLHGVVGLALLVLKPPVEELAKVIELQTVELPKPPKPPEPPEAAPAPAAAPRPAPRPAAPPPAAAPAAAPEFGLVLGAADGPGGIAVPTAAPPPQQRQATKKLVAAKTAPEDGCAEEASRPKATSMPHPAYTDEARAAGVEGKVRVELSVDTSGAVTEARVLEGLGHGLDDAAVAAVRGAKFSPALRCGAPVSSTFVISVRFAL